ncbi:MAG: TonB-dependent receptor [Sphingobacteriales bacterium]|nr:TonB-dependent receptor [Sphingobacteriales bacterium]
MNFRNFLMLAFCMLSSTLLFAQSEQKEIRLLDEESKSPIIGATFKYGEQSGLSDENGVIRFSYDQKATLQLSHINYGAWSLSEIALNKAISDKVIYRKAVIVNLFPVTVLALKPQSVQQKGEIKIEYQDRLEHDAANILNQIPAFNSIRKGGNYGFDPVFRGFKNDQLNVVLNGAQSATAACPNRMDPPTSQMAPNMIDRIEIFKGPYALRFGTGIGATINFIPAKLRFSDKPDLYGRISSGYENNGNLQRGEGQLGLSGAKYDVNLFASWSQGDDYTTGNKQTVQADFKRGSFGTNIGIKLASNQELRLSANYNRARDADFPALGMDLRTDDTYMLNAVHDIQFMGKKLQSLNTTIYGSFVNHLMDNLLRTISPRMMNVQTFATTRNFGGRSESVWKLSNGKIYAGADLRVEGAEGTKVRDYLMGPMAGKTKKDNVWQDGYISKTGLFTEYQINGKTFNYIASGRLELNVANLNDPAQGFTQVNPETQTTQVNPSLSFGILKDFGNKVKSGLWLARAQRSGSLTERYINYFTVGQDPYEMLGNPQLAPEVNYQTDLTFTFNFYEKSSINVDVFAAYLKNYISSVIDTTLSPELPSSPGVRRFVNINEAFKTGFEISWNQVLFAGLSHRIGIAYTYGQDLERDQPLPEIAPLDARYALYGSYLKNRLKPEVTFRYVTKQSRTSTEFGETVTPSFNLLDFKIGYQINSSIFLNAGVNNLFDENYYEHLNRSVSGTNKPIYAPGRNYFINLNYSF